MTNKEKVEALVDELGIIYTDCNRATIKKLLMEMAEWKDEQYKEREDGLRETINMLDARLQKANDSVMYYFDQCNIQKQQLIDNVCEWLKNNIDDYMMTGEGEFQEYFDDMYVDLKEAMK